ncbi:hypothetical protein [Halovenus marina]|uniref:hypothetical protein n=1 Tax=Halovenus marina TaxID=3396621 RepID=UPI003F549F05
MLTLGILTGGAAADDSVTRTESNITVEDSVVESDRPDPLTDTLGRPGTDTTPRNDDVATTDDEGPGFGIVAVGIGFVLVVLLLVSKSRR